MDNTIIVAIVAAISALVSGVVGSIVTLNLARQRNRIEQPKIDADSVLAHAQAADSRSEAASEIQSAALALLQPYKEEVERLRVEVSSLRAEVSSLRVELQEVKGERDIVIGGAHQLYHQVISMGGKPVYRPPERRGQACDLCAPDAEQPSSPA